MRRTNGDLLIIMTLAAVVLPCGGRAAVPPDAVPPDAVPRNEEETIHDVVVYGGTSGGVAAAIQAARMGKSVVLIEPTRRLGGLTTGGLGQTDIGNKAAIGGIAREFYRAIRAHYANPAAWRWQAREDYRSGGQTRTGADEDAMWTFEPSVALEVIDGWIRSAGIDVRYGERLDRNGGVALTRSIPWRILAIRMESGATFRGRMFIDATYEGDLLAAANVRFTVGREGNDRYGETLNGVQVEQATFHQFAPGVDPYVRPGDPASGLLPFIDPHGPGEEGTGDRRVQAYCFRMCLTDHPDNRIPFHKPADYDERWYELLLRNYEAGERGLPWINSAMPNRKTDTNNRLGFSTDFIGQNYDYPEASHEERARIVARHRQYQQGLMWTLAHHPRIPEEVRREVSRWGVCKDEFTEGAGWQEQLYVREARRMISDHVMTQHQCQGREAVTDSVGLAAYTMDSHHVQRYVTSAGQVRNEGDVEVGGFPPYPIAYRSIVPAAAECGNLLVPVCLSATHIAFGSIRMEPVFMVLGQSAATAAALAIDAQVSVQEVDYPKLRERLRADGQVLEWAPDAAAAPRNAAGWKVGVARACITPPEFMWMSGYGARTRPAEGKHTDLWAKAIALTDHAGTRHVLVTLDLVGIDRETSRQITTAIAARHDLPREAIVLSTTHTHSGPVVGNNLRPMYALDDAGWALVRRSTARLREVVVEVVDAALADLRPAEIGWTVGRAHFAVNRRTNKEGDVPELRAADRLAGPVDHDVPVLLVREPGRTGDEGVRALVVGYACHATVLDGYEWSGDWPGSAQIELEKRYPQATALVWAGCGADQNPQPRRALEFAERHGAELAAAVVTAVERRVVPLQGTLAAAFTEIPLEFSALPSRADLEQAAASSHRFQAARARLLLEAWDRDGGLPTSYPYPVQTWRLGDGPHWVFLSGEVVVDFAVRLKSELGCGRTWVAAYCNDVMAYIASRRVLAEGGYEGATAMVYYGLPAPWAASSEDAIVGAVRAQVAATGGVAADAPRTVSARAYPDHTDLTVAPDDTGGGLVPIVTPADWERRRRDILDGMQVVMGRLPGTAELGPLEFEERGRETLAGCTRLLLTYSAGPGQRATAHLYLPAEGVGTNLVGPDGRRPAVLALHPTSKLGKAIVAGEGPLPNRGYALELARRGYVVLAPDYPSFGESADYDFHLDQHASGTMAAVVNHRRGVDLLVGRPEVDAARIGAIGHSLGGHNAIFLGVFDPRIKAVVSSCGWDPFHAYKGGTLTGWAQDRYMQRVRELAGCDPDRMPCDFPEIVAALAPRGFFSSSPLGDGNFSAPAVAAAEPGIRRVYDRLGAADRFILRQPDCLHDFPPDVREEAYAFLDRLIALPDR